MKKIAFDKEQRAEMVKRIQRYFSDDMDQELGNIPAELLLGFFTEQIGPFYYNQGLADAQKAFARSLDDVNDMIYSLEQREARVPSR